MKFTEFEKGLKLEGTVLDRRRKITPEEADTIRELRAKNSSVVDLCKKYKISRSQIYRLCNKDIYLKSLEYVKKYQANKANFKELNAKSKKESRQYKKELYNAMCLAKSSNVCISYII